MSSGGIYLPHRFLATGRVASLHTPALFFLSMATSAKSFPMLAKTLYGLEDLLIAELTSLGARSCSPRNRAVQFTGDKALLYRANVACRLATRILKPIYQFSTANADSLYRHVNRIDWGRYLTPETSMVIDTVISHSSFTNSLYVAQCAKDAIVDHIRKKTGRRPSIDIKKPDSRINLHIHENQATLSLDSSGEPLSRRGYRLDAGEAPIGEVLAAGILDLIGWSGEKPLADPMCGSGTFVIEAALKSRGIIPGVSGRKYGFMRWPDYDQQLFNKIINATHETGSAAAQNPRTPIRGYDIDGRQITCAQSNAQRADVDSCVSFGKQNFFADDYQIRDSVVVFNPPYNQRLSLSDARAFYKQIGDTLKAKYVGSTVYIITANLEAIKSIGLKATRKIKLYNGPLECRLLEYRMFSGKRRDNWGS